jgi:glyoxylase-like metal-dependent hydrolase (beta-lactamase superfamily II)
MRPAPKLVPLPGHTFGHRSVAYREDGKWSLHAGDAYFDSKVNFEKDVPGLPIEIAFQTNATIARRVSGGYRR